MNKVLLLFGLFLIGILPACSSADKKATETAEDYFGRAKELEKDGRTEEAIAKLEELKNKFPYSKLVPDAELASGEISFNNEDYAEAQVTYALFRDLHPKHPRSDYVVYRLGLSIYKQIPESIDRDLSLAHEAISVFQDLINQYPQSEHVAEAKDKRLECMRKLAEKELYIANFYLKKENWQSALGRLDVLLKDHKDLGLDEQVLARAVVAAKNAKQQDRSEALLAQFKERFPNSKELIEMNNKYSSR